MRKSVVATMAFTAAAMLALTLMPVVPLSTPAVAKPVVVSQSKLEAACKRTPSCAYNKRDGVGCTSNVCFHCKNGKCQSYIRGTKTPSSHGDLGTLLNPPKGKTVGTNHQGTRAPLGPVGVKSTTPKGASGPIVRAGGKR